MTEILPFWSEKEVEKRTLRDFTRDKRIQIVQIGSTFRAPRPNDFAVKEDAKTTAIIVGVTASGRYSKADATA